MLTRIVSIAALGVAPLLMNAQECVSEKPPHDGALRMVVDERGIVYERPARRVTEREDLVIVVRTQTTHAERLTVRRTSPMRSVGVGSIAGAPATDPVRIANNAAAHCFLTVQLGDFAPGRATIEFGRAASGTEAAVVLGTVDFLVDPVHIGSFSVGPVGFRLPQPTYSALALPGDTTLSVSLESERMAYAFFYSPYLDAILPAGLRNSLTRRLNPAFGVTLTDIRANLLIGASIELPAGLTLHYGAHFGKVRTLDPQLGVAVGGSLNDLGLRTIPTIETWKWSQYAGIALDPRILALVFGAAGNTTVPDR